MVINVNLNRDHLIEGRNSGMGFAFLSRSKNTYTGIMSVSCCKDYLNDVVIAENEKNNYPSIYGFVYQHQNLFKSRRRYLFINIQGCRENCMTSNLAEMLNKLFINHKQLESIINEVENKLDVKSKTKIYKTNANGLLVNFSSYWTQTTYHISFYSLMLRIFMFYEGDVSIEEFAEKYAKKVYYEDALYLKEIPKLIKIFSENEIEQTEKEDIKLIHNRGAMSILNKYAT